MEHTLCVCASCFHERPTEIIPLPLCSKAASVTFSTDTDDSPAVDQINASNKGKGAGEFFDTSSQSVSEECSEESSDTKFFNITFCLPEKDFRSYFSGRNKSIINSKVSNISIPKGVEQIEPEIFMGCSLLTNISIPNSVISIGKKAFYNCSLLTNITISNSVISIGKKHFTIVHYLQILQFQTVLKKLVMALFQDVYHLQILQFQIMLKKLVNIFYRLHFYLKNQN